MPRRGDNIHRRKDGRWEARYIPSTPYPTAKKYVSVYGKTYKEAKEKRDALLYQNCVEPRSSQGTTVKDVLTSWQAANQVHLKASTISRYQNLIDIHILPQLGNLKINHLTTSTINLFLAEKMAHGRADGSGGLSPAYVRSISVVLSSSLKHGIAEGLCYPLKAPIIRPSLPKKELRILSPKEQNVLEQELLNHMDPDRLLILITLYTGLRIGEVCALRWEDINIETRVLYVRHTVSRHWYMQDQKKISTLQIGLPKTGASSRCIPLCSKLYSVLLNIPFRKEKGYISSSMQSEAFISPRTFEYRYKKILRDCHLEAINYHALRHTFATRCVERGVDIKSLSEILGHANVAITLNTYVHSSIEQKRLQLEKLNP